MADLSVGLPVYFIGLIYFGKSAIPVTNARWCCDVKLDLSSN